MTLACALWSQAVCILAVDIITASWLSFSEINWFSVVFCCSKKPAVLQTAVYRNNPSLLVHPVQQSCLGNLEQYTGTRGHENGKVQACWNGVRSLTRPRCQLTWVTRPNPIAQTQTYSRSDRTIGSIWSSNSTDTRTYCEPTRPISLTMGPVAKSCRASQCLLAWK